MRSDIIKDRSYNSLSWDIPRASAHTTYPTKEKPDGKYKFASFDLYVSFDSYVTERETYNLLDWLGDIGGLCDALVYMSEMLILPLSVYTLKAELLSSLFRRKLEIVAEESPKESKDLS